MREDHHENKTLVLSQDGNERLIEWFLSGETGLSSKAMVRRILGIERDMVRFDRPWDKSDFGRCLGLLEYVPEFKDHLHLMKGIDEAWDDIVDRWDILETAYKQSEYFDDYHYFQNIFEGKSSRAIFSEEFPKINPRRDLSFLARDYSAARDDLVLTDEVAFAGTSADQMETLAWSPDLKRPVYADHVTWVRNNFPGARFYAEKKRPVIVAVKDDEPVAVIMLRNTLFGMPEALMNNILTDRGVSFSPELATSKQNSIRP